MPATTSVKEEARRLVDRLADDATWADVAHTIHVRRLIERGLADVAAGRVVDHEDVFAEYELPE